MTTYITFMQLGNVQDQKTEALLFILQHCVEERRPAGIYSSISPYETCGHNTNKTGLSRHAEPLKQCHKACKKGQVAVCRYPPRRVSGLGIWEN